MYTPAVTQTPINFEYAAPTLQEYRQRMAAIMKTYPWIVREIDASDRRVLLRRAASNASGIPVVGRARRIRSPGLSSHGRRRVGCISAPFSNCSASRGFHRAFAGITIPNDASVALHLSMGFELIGVYKAAGFKLGSWRDAAWYQRMIGDRLLR